MDFKIDFMKFALENKNKVVLSICAVTALIIAALYVFRPNIFESFTNSYKPNSGSSGEGEGEEGSSGSEGSPVEIMLFSVDWCPHCKVARPEWNKVAESTKMVKGRKIIFTDINCTDETPEVTKLIKKYNIEGYPTIKLLKDGKVFDFDAKPTANHLTQFLEQVI
jgi:thiol-disulfide isomerase/thioredoxin